MTHFNHSLKPGYQGGTAKPFEFSSSNLNHIMNVLSRQSSRLLFTTSASSGLLMSVNY